jgi:uncharacterized protein (DUF924 family)
MTTPEAVLTYWFGPELPADDAAVRPELKRWFMGGPDVDRDIQERFGRLLEQARRGDLDEWASTPRGRLALIIVLDQFSRNAYRGTPLAFAQDEGARKLTLAGLDRGDDRDLLLLERIFFYLPLEHAEDLKSQDRFVAIVHELAASAPATLREFMGIAVDQARQHRETVARFGRFPQRNGALGRESTPEEVAFLEGIKQK